MEKRFVYADNAATTKISPSVLDAMMPYLTDDYGNASGVYSAGRRAKRAVETAREQTAALIGCNSEELYFTSGGTESDNWALTGICRMLKSQGKNHIITSSIEHHAVLHTCDFLRAEGFDITLLPVQTDGTVEPQSVKNAVTDRTALVSVMYANNETGIIQPVSDIANICHENNILFHTDAVQAVGHININVKDQNIDLLSMSGHKFGAPKGIGALFIRKEINIPNFIFGGAQEKGHRPGTENVAAAVGIGKAALEAYENMNQRYKYTSALRDKLTDGLLSISGVTLNGSKENRLPGHCSISLRDADGEALLLMLDLKGICASAGSACTSGDSTPSHVLTAMGADYETALGSIRFSLSHNNTEDDVDYILKTFNSVIQKLRKI